MPQEQCPAPRSIDLRNIGAQNSRRCEPCLTANHDPLGASSSPPCPLARAVLRRAKPTGLDPAAASRPPGARPVDQPLHTPLPARQGVYQVLRDGSQGRLHEPASPARPPRHPAPSLPARQGRSADALVAPPARPRAPRHAAAPPLRGHGLRLLGADAADRAALPAVDAVHVPDPLADRRDPAGRPGARGRAAAIPAQGSARAEPAASAAARRARQGGGRPRLPRPGDREQALG